MNRGPDPAVRPGSRNWNNEYCVVFHYSHNAKLHQQQLLNYLGRMIQKPRKTFQYLLVCLTRIAITASICCRPYLSLYFCNQTLHVAAHGSTCSLSFLLHVVRTYWTVPRSSRRLALETDTAPVKPLVLTMVIITSNHVSEANFLTHAVLPVVVALVVVRIRHVVGIMVVIVSLRPRCMPAARPFMGWLVLGWCPCRCRAASRGGCVRVVATNSAVCI